ncbi:hypothetical protein [Crateriforma conspicua]|nr:hypothetical protein [Crateriforma conspicua]
MTKPIATQSLERNEINLRVLWVRLLGVDFVMGSGLLFGFAFT